MLLVVLSAAETAVGAMSRARLHAGIGQNGHGLRSLVDNYIHHRQRVLLPRGNQAVLHRAARPPVDDVRQLEGLLGNVQRAGLANAPTSTLDLKLPVTALS